MAGGPRTAPFSAIAFATLGGAHFFAERWWADAHLGYGNTANSRTSEPIQSTAPLETTESTRVWWRPIRRLSNADYVALQEQQLKQLSVQANSADTTIVDSSAGLLSARKS